MNAIDTLIAAGRLDDLVKAGKPGETVTVGDRGAQCSSGGATAEVERIHAQFKDAAPEGYRVTLWLARSSDGERAMGEVVVDKGHDTPMVVWEIGKGGAPKLDYGSQRSVLFASASDRLEVSADPMSMLPMVDHPQADVAEALVQVLGYQPVMDFPGDLRITFRDVNLEMADA